MAEQPQKLENDAATSFESVGQRNTPQSEIETTRTNAREVIGEGKNRDLTNMTESDLVDVIEFNSSMRMQAWKQLLSQGPTKHYLVEIFGRVGSLREEAWEKFLSMNPTNAELIEVIELVPAVRLRAWEKLLLQNPSKEDFLTIAKKCSASMLEMCWEQLLDRGVSNGELCRFISMTEEMARYELGNQKAKNFEVRLGMIRDLQTRIWEKLLEQDPTREELLFIVEFAPSLASKAENTLSDLDPTYMRKYKN